MADDKGDMEGSIWPLPKFYYSVKALPIEASFSEVTGLDAGTDVIDYPAGDSKSFPPIKMPGLGKVGNVTMRKGIFVNDGTLLDWCNQI